MHYCIFEDALSANFLPLTYFRPVYDLRCGVLTLREKILRRLPRRNVVLHSRLLLTDILSESSAVNRLPDDDVCFINGRILAKDNLAKVISQVVRSKDRIVNGETVLVAFVSRGDLRALFPGGFPDLISAERLPGSHVPDFPLSLVSYPWDLILNTAEEITRDSQLVKRPRLPASLLRHTHVVGKRHVWIGRNCVIKPGVVLDAEKGPIIIGEGVTIMPNAVIEGPAFIGDRSVIKIGAKIYHGSSFGEYCKVGGEVDNAVLQSYSNKQHDGFLGHAYLGSWVNLGADTNNSDLKNNYSTVRVKIGGAEVDTGSQFMGLIMGDHSKTGINVMFDTGTNVGVSCNIYGAGLPPKYLPSFSWGSGLSYTTYDLEKSLETARRVMRRRSVEVTPGYERLFRSVFSLTQSERSSVQ